MISQGGGRTCTDSDRAARAWPLSRIHWGLSTPSSGRSPPPAPAADEEDEKEEEEEEEEGMTLS